MTRGKTRSSAIVLAGLMTTGVGGALIAQQPQVPGAFRSRVVLVPVDVRVLDRDGNPVTDLVPEDFVVLEDGRPQRIGHFSTHVYAPQPVATGASGPALRRSAGLSPEVPAGRTFLLVLGRGRLDGPARGLDALSVFVRESLLPQDYVGFIAYNRTSALTTDRTRVIRFLDRYRADHARIETLLRAHAGRRGSLHALFGRGVPADVQRHIDALFQDPELPDTRVLPPLALDGVRRVESEWRRDQLERGDFRRGLTLDRSPNPLRAPPITIAGQQDLEKLYVGIEYLRYLEAEKHLIFLSEDGLRIGRPEHHDSLAAAAADARVTLTLIRTGGLPSGLAAWRNGEWAMTDWFFASDSRPVAAMTGGIASDFEPAATGLSRLERATRFQYLIGYYPSNSDWNGTFRRIEVRAPAARPGLSVLHRGGYYAHDELVPYDRSRFLTHAWMLSAAAYRDRLTDIGVGVRASPGAPGRLAVEVTVNPAHVTVTDAGGAFLLSFDLAVFAAGNGDEPVGELWRRADVSLTPADWARLQAGEFIAWRGSVDVTGAARTVKAVVYDAERDRLGTAVNRVR